MSGSHLPIAVVALGGNALVRAGERGDIDQQLGHIRESVAHLPLLLEKGYRLVLTHGNGPVVGHLLLQNEAAKDIVPPMPLDVCDADSEGSIGYLTQQSLVNELKGRQKDLQVVSLITQIVVDANDEAFSRPTKPVGPFYSSEVAKALARSKGWRMIEDAGRGFRRVVPSPRPIEVVELEPIRILLKNGIVVIAAGGGGIPVIRTSSGRLKGVEAVIDKDRASALLASGLKAEQLVILTAVEGVYRRFGQPDQQIIRLLDLRSAKKLLDAGEFAAGSMAPKIEAAVEFLRAGGREVLITLPESLDRALDGRTGTRLVP